MQDNAAPNAIPNRTPQRVRHELRMRLLEVRDVEALTPNMRRVTLGGDDLEGFESPGFDDHVKLFFPDPQTGELVLPKVGPEGVAKPAPGDAPRLMRDYTPRRFDAATRQWTLRHATPDGRLRPYPGAPRSRDFLALLREFDRDPCGLFWQRVNGASLRAAPTWDQVKFTVPATGPTRLTVPMQYFR